MASHPLPHADRFWSKVDRRTPDECWPWLGRKNSRGYGQIRRTHRGVTFAHMATKVAWSLHNGAEFPADAFALHSCDNPACVNPHHLRPGNHAENMADRLKRGRLTKWDSRRAAIVAELCEALRMCLLNGNLDQQERDRAEAALSKARSRP